MFTKWYCVPSPEQGDSIYYSLFETNLLTFEIYRTEVLTLYCTPESSGELSEPMPEIRFRSIKSVSLGMGYGMGSVCFYNSPGDSMCSGG